MFRHALVVYIRITILIRKEVDNKFECLLLPISITEVRDVVTRTGAQLTM